MRITALALAALYACAPASSRVKTTHNDYDASTLVEMADNRLCRGEAHGGYELFLTASRYSDRDGKPFYGLTARYEGADWLRVGRGRTLQLTLDGTAETVAGDGSERFREAAGPGSVRERAQYAVDAAVLRRLAAAKAAGVRLNGERRGVDCVLSPENLESFRRFVSQYVH